MAKNEPRSGKSARRGNSPAPYTKYDKKPYPYPGKPRLASGELQEPANQAPGNKYR